MRNTDLEIWTCANITCNLTTTRYQTVRINGMDIVLCHTCAQKATKP